MLGSVQAAPPRQDSSAAGRSPPTAAAAAQLAVRARVLGVNSSPGLFRAGGRQGAVGSAGPVQDAPGIQPRARRA